MTLEIAKNVTQWQCGRRPHSLALVLFIALIVGCSSSLKVETNESGPVSEDEFGENEQNEEPKQVNETPVPEPSGKPETNSGSHKPSKPSNADVFVSFYLNSSGAKYTRSPSVTIFPTANPSHVAAYKFGLADCSSTGWIEQDLPSSIVIELANVQGKQTICLQVKDQEGNVSKVATGSIIYDSLAPSLPATTSSTSFNQMFTAMFTESAPQDDFFEFRYTIVPGEEVSCEGGFATSGAIQIPPQDTTIKIITCDRAGNGSESLVVPFTYDADAPSITSVTSSNINGSYKEDEVITIDVLFSEPITVNGTASSLLLSSGGIATFDGAVSSDTLRYLYTVDAGERAVDLSVLAFNLNSDSIADAATNGLNTTLPPLTNLEHQKDIEIATECDFRIFNDDLDSGKVGTLSFAHVVDGTNAFSEFENFLDAVSNAQDPNGTGRTEICLYDTIIENPSNSLTGPIVLDFDNVSLKGFGTVIFNSSRVSGSTVLDHGALLLDGAQGVVLDNIRLRTSGSRGIGLTLQNVSVLDEVAGLTVTTSGDKAHGVFLDSNSAVMASSGLDLQRASDASGDASGILFAGGGFEFFYSSAIKNVRFCFQNVAQQWTHLVADGSVDGPWVSPSAHVASTGIVWGSQTFPFREDGSWTHFYNMILGPVECDRSPDIRVSSNMSFSDFQTLIDGATDVNADGRISIELQNRVKISSTETDPAPAIMLRNGVHIFSTWGVASEIANERTSSVSNNAIEHGVFVADGVTNTGLSFLTIRTVGLGAHALRAVNGASVDYIRGVTSSNYSGNVTVLFINQSFVSEILGLATETNIESGGTGNTPIIRIENSSQIGSIENYFPKTNTGFRTPGIGVTDSTVGRISWYRGELSGKWAYFVSLNNSDLTLLENCYDVASNQQDYNVRALAGSSIGTIRKCDLRSSWTGDGIYLVDSNIGAIEDTSMLHDYPTGNFLLGLFGSSVISSIVDSTFGVRGVGAVPLFMKDSSRIESMTNSTLYRFGTAAAEPIILVDTSGTGTPSFSTANITGNTICRTATASVSAWLAEGTLASYTEQDSFVTAADTNFGTGVRTFPWGDNGSIDGTDERDGAFTGNPGQNDVGMAMQKQWRGICP